MHPSVPEQGWLYQTIDQKNLWVFKNIKDYNLSFTLYGPAIYLWHIKVLTGWTGREIITFIILKESIAKKKKKVKEDSLEIKGKCIDINPTPSLHLWTQRSMMQLQFLKNSWFMV